MGRYHFNLYDGIRIMDDAGIELKSLVEARKHAMRYLGMVLSDSAEEFFEENGWRLEATDSRGLILFTIHVFSDDGAAVASR